jgi:hypothetical protein
MNRQMLIQFPKTALGLDYELEGFNAGAGFAANSFEIDNTADAALHGKRVDSWIVYGHAGLQVSGLIFNFNAAYGQNPGNFGTMLMINLDESAPAAAIDEDAEGKKTVKNVRYYEAFAEIGYNYDIFTFMAGAGVAQAKNTMRSYVNITVRQGNVATTSLCH